MNKRLIINIKTVCLILLILPFIQQRSMLEFPTWLVELYKIGTILSSTIIYIIAFNQHRKYRKSKVFYTMLLFWGTYIFVTLVNSFGNFINVLYVVYYSIAVVLLLLIEYKKNRERLFFSLSFIYGTFIFLNWLLYILYPDGLYQISSGHIGHSTLLLGDDNAIAYVAIPGLICLSLYSYFKYKKIKIFVWIEIIITEWTLISVWAASGMIAVGLFGAALAYIEYIGNINPKVIISIFTVIAISIFMGLSNRFISGLIVKYLHKDITLTGRTYLWMHAFDMILMKPLLGYGGYFKYGSWKLGAFSYSCHTTFLQLLIDGGILLFSIFCYITYTSYKNMSRNKDGRISPMLSIGLGCMFLNYITEYAYLVHFNIIITIMLLIGDYPTLVNSRRVNVATNKVS
ncbi:O-antigen ligase family protein [Eubacterium ventriosum]|uniref:O-antigen ligase family protein n=1 Tax=Eubacterium ventriosum TaxID=39496 RepID=UPI003AB2F547